MSRHDSRTALTFSLALLALVLSIAAVLLAACGDAGSAGDPSRSPSSSLSKSPSLSPPAATRGSVLVVVADAGFEDIELSTVRDGLVEAGYRPVIASAAGGEALGSGGSTVATNMKLADAVAADFVGVALIGGSGSAQYLDDAGLHALLRETVKTDKPVGAICLAPVILARAGLLKGREATVWKDNRAELEQAGCSKVGTGVVVDGTIVTADGPDSSEGFRDAFLSCLETASRDSNGP